MGVSALPFQNLPLGFRFKPSDVELIDHYLRLKINGKCNEVSCIGEVDICRVEPWDLPDLSVIKTNDHEWFFFCPRDRKYPNGQRSNRATGAGYWKATGKDRNIKSRKMGLIGMKKTLVFYMGRAPKGQRTHWVIHEYRTTLQELDGTRPGQGAFVLCRLFKKADDLKQDGNDDGSNTDEVETNIFSPNPTNISLEDVRLDLVVVQASPGSVEQSVEQQMISENRIVKTSDGITSGAICPDHSQVNEERAHEVDSHVSEAIEHLYNPHKPYFKWQLGHVNQGPLGMEDLFPAQYGFPLQDIDGRDTVSDFLDSVLNPDGPFCNETGHQGAPIAENDLWKNASVKESRSCSASDVEAAELQHDVGFTGCTTVDGYYSEPKSKELPVQNHSVADDDDIFSDAALDRFCNLPNVGDPLCYAQIFNSSFLKPEDGNHDVGNGIKIRSHLRRRQLLSSTGNVEQGTAPKRLQLQMNLKAPINKVEKESQPAVTEGKCLSKEMGFADMGIDPHEDIIYLAEVSDNAAAADQRESSVEGGEIETGIKIRTHLRRSQPSPSSSVVRGTTHRRISLQNQSTYDSEDDTAEPPVAETRNLSEKVGEKTCAGKSVDISIQKSSSLKRSWRVHVINVVMVVFLFMACIGLWRARNVVS